MYNTMGCWSRQCLTVRFQSDMAFGSIYDRVRKRGREGGREDLDR